MRTLQAGDSLKMLMCRTSAKSGEKNEYKIDYKTCHFGHDDRVLNSCDRRMFENE